ncbi:hypothetical protein GGX14DRAFT_555681 [Mycena pura]|uniref:Uncharacterized protein n=1 Tax=Mycena pura TaxID=153505 RepID=A0AAD6YRB1_9AGAR|nr:hypothetical protein GGX14DRAFT_555681 [Mycena pura]
MGAYASDEDAVIVDSSHDSELDIVRPARVMGLVEQLPEDFQEMVCGRPMSCCDGRPEIVATSIAARASILNSMLWLL